MAGADKVVILALPLQCVPEAADDRGAVRAGDRFPLGAADVMQDVIAPLHCHLHPRGSLGGVQWPAGSCQVLNMHIVFPQQHQLHLELSPTCRDQRRHYQQGSNLIIYKDQALRPAAVLQTGVYLW